MNTSEWTYTKHQGGESAPKGGNVSVPVSINLGTAANVLDVWCDHGGAFHVPAHLEGEVVSWLADQGYITERQAPIQHEEPAKLAEQGETP